MSSKPLNFLIAFVIGGMLIFLIYLGATTLSHWSPDFTSETIENRVFNTSVPNTTLLIAYSKELGTEIIRLHNGTKCKGRNGLRLKSLPLESPGTGGMMSTDDANDAIPTPVICGGFGGNYAEEVKSCFFMNPYSTGSTNWTYLGGMAVGRHQAASVVINGDTLWITGGYNQNEQGTSNLEGVLGTTEVIKMIKSLNSPNPEFSTVSGPYLSTKVKHHCMIQINSSMVILIGGNTRNSLRDSGTAFFRVGGDTWHNAWIAQNITGPRLSYGRSQHVCGIMIDPTYSPPDGANSTNSEGEGQLIVVAGGEGDIRGNGTTEFLKLGIIDAWILGPEVPLKISGAAGIVTPDKDKFLMIGGHTSKSEVGKWETEDLATIFILEFIWIDSNSGAWEWSKLEQELKAASSGHSAFLLPADFDSDNCTLI